MSLPVRTCKHVGCTYPRWSQGYCKLHTLKKVAPLKKRALPPKKVTGELKFFLELWAVRPHVSYISGRPIPYFSPSACAHVLPKGRYPELRLNSTNIVFLHPDEHTLYDQGTAQQRATYALRYPTTDWAKLYTLREHLLSTLQER
jgi:hypothetical protein